MHLEPHELTNLRTLIDFAINFANLNADWTAIAMDLEIKLGHMRIEAERKPQSPELMDAMHDVTSDLFLQVESKHGPKVASEYPSIVAARAVIAKHTGN